MSIRQAPNEVAPLTHNKRLRMDKNEQCSTLKRRLHALLKEGSFTDVELVVTTDNGDVKLPAHKNILAAMSSVIATKMTPRWEEGGQGPDVLEIPSDVGVNAVEMFLKFLYKEELDEDLSVEIYLELIFLADHYQVEDLRDLCDDKLMDKLNLENCIKIYEKSRLFQEVQCAKSAFKLFQKSLYEILERFSSEWIRMDASTLKTILELNYLPNVEEIELYLGLKLWKDENVEERASDFQNLVKLIRFPLIGVENLAEFVVPSRDLDAELINQMFVYFVGKGPFPEQFENYQPRNLLEPKDSVELQKFIDESQNGDIIELNGTYSSFVIPETKTNLTIKGKQGAEAIIKINDESGIQIFGQQIKINHLSIITNISEDDFFATAAIFVNKEAKQNDLANIKIIGGYHGLIIQGNENSFNNISIIDTIHAGVFIEGDSCKNEISNCSIIFNGKETIGFYIAGSGQNKFSNLSAENTSYSYLGSTRNVLNGFIISGGYLTIDDGENHIENVSISGNNSELGVSNNANKVLVNNCQADNIFIQGNCQTVENSKANQLRVVGKGHKFNNCEADVLNLALCVKIKSTKCVFRVTQRKSFL